MKQIYTTILLLVLCFSFAQAQWNDTITFSPYPTGTIITNEYLDHGVIFTGYAGSTDPEIYDYGAATYGRVLHSDNWYNPFRMNFVDTANALITHLVKRIEFDNAVGGGEIDYVSVDVYNSSNTLIYHYMSVSPERVVIDFGIPSAAYLVVDDSDATAYIIDDILLDFGNSITPLTATSSSSVPLCFGNCNGSATVTAAGGTAPYHFLWQPGNDTTATKDSLCAGSIYFFTVIDALGTALTDSVVMPAINPIPVNINSSTTGICNGDSAAICATFGFAIYGWSNGDTSTCITTPQAGSYTVTVTTANNCTVVSNSINIAAYAAPHDSVYAPQTFFCSGDSTEVCATTSSVSYLWNTGETTNCIYANHAGNYYVTVTDANNCTVVSNHLAINVYPIPPVSVSVNGDTLHAFNAVTYQWYLNDTLINGATNSIYVANQTGDYSVAITDTNGCRVTSNAVSVVVSGIAPFNNQQSVISVHPNPATDQLFIETNGEEIKQVNVYNMLGERVMTVPINAQYSILNTAILPSGVYIAEVKTQHTSMKKRWVKE